MKNEIKEIYLSNENSRFIGTHDNMGCATIHGILTKNITYEEYVDIISKTKYFLLVDKDYITNLQEKYDRMKENAKILSNGYNELEKRNEKAIEYIGNGNIGIPKKTREKAIKILKGESNDK